MNLNLNIEFLFLQNNNFIMFKTKAPIPPNHFCNCVAFELSNFKIVLFIVFIFKKSNISFQKLVSIQQPRYIKNNNKQTSLQNSTPPSPLQMTHLNIPYKQTNIDYIDFTDINMAFFGKTSKLMLTKYWFYITNMYN